MGRRSLSSFRDPATLAVGALATFRLTRLLILDEVTRPLRERLELLGEEAQDPLAQTKLGYFVNCPWCVSPWVAAGWAAFVATAPTVAAPVGAALAWSAVAGLLASWE